MAGNRTDAAASKGHEPDATTDRTDDDHVLVAAVRDGDGNAFAVLVDRHGARLHASLLHLAAGDADTAAELTQEAFVRAFERLDRFAGRSSFYTWLYRLARNRAIDVLARKRPVATENERLDATPRAAASPAATLERTETRQLVRTALERLPYDQRELLIMRDFEGCDYPGIAERLEVAVGTVKSRLHRARRALRDLIASQLSGDDL
ncbi:MAG: RNA polymerase sigma factor [Planctomycetota bacterium]